jgi:ABC-type nitrate/sulfonate/bicarbonate transport system substrate-binding protein
MVAENSWISSNPKQLKEYQAAFAEAVAWMQKPANFAAAETIMKTVIGSSYSPAIVKSITTDEVDHVLQGYENVTSLQHEYAADLAVGAISTIPGIDFGDYIAPGTATTAAAVAKLANSAGH